MLHVSTNLGIDNGIVMCTGDIYALDPINGGGFPSWMELSHIL